MTLPPPFQRSQSKQDSTRYFTFCDVYRRRCFSERHASLNLNVARRWTWTSRIVGFSLVARWRRSPSRTVSWWSSTREPSTHQPSSRPSPASPPSERGLTGVETRRGLPGPRPWSTPTTQVCVVLCRKWGLLFFLSKKKMKVYFL